MKASATAALVVLTLFSVCGCGSNTPPPVAEADPTTPTVAGAQDKSPFPTPDFSQPSRLYMIADNETPAAEDDIQLTVGDGPEKFKTAFPRSAKISQKLDGQLPFGAEPPRWTATGWALDDASRGFGALYYDNRLALVMAQFDSVEEPDIDKEVKKYEGAFGEATHLPGKNARYWFWQRGSVALMVCAYKNQEGELDLTTGIGDGGVMARLHMTPGTALDDQRAVDKLHGIAGASSSAAQDTQ